jgi:hypothetical protein
MMPALAVETANEAAANNANLQYFMKYSPQVLTELTSENAKRTIRAA